MPKVIFEHVGFAVEVPDGARLVDVCDDHPRAAVPFSCRAANCGTCRVQVLEGLEHCAPPSPAEEDLAELFSDPPTVRVACQLRLLPGAGTVRLKVVEDD